MKEVNNYSSISSYSLYSNSSDDLMYEAVYNQLSGGKGYIDNNATVQTSNRKIRDLIPEIDIDELLKKRERILAGENVPEYKDLHEINAAIGLAYSLRELSKLLNDPSISDSEAMRLYNMLITYVEYNGNSTEQDSGVNRDHGLDDIITQIKKHNNTLDFIFNTDNNDKHSRPDSTYFRELTTYIEISLKKIKEETTIDIMDKKKKLAEAYFTGNRYDVDYWTDRKEEK